MGIYISGVKGLPEQVQQNKEDIKTIQDEIEGIDFEQIRELEEQVGENTQDINNLENAIGVQNQAINTLNDDVDALESKTQLMSYNDDLSKTDFRNSIEVADDVIASGVHVNGDGVIVNSNGSGLHFQEGANDDTLTIFNNDGANPHYLQLDGDGNLTLDGNPVGGTTLYQHNIFISAGTAWRIFLTIISDRSEAYDRSSLSLYMTPTKGKFLANGFYKNTSLNIFAPIVYINKADASNYEVGYVDDTQLQISVGTLTVNNTSVSDTFYQIA